MTIAALIATALLALVALGFTAGAILFLIKSRPTKKTAPDAPLPKAAILLALRGPDPYLDQCLRSLMHQDYPDYDLHIVVDAEKDPAWNIVRRVIDEERATNVHAALLRDPLFTCSLKCSALLQMLGEVDPEVEVLALIDGDVVPHRHWLRHLAAPLANEAAGATFGIPWYFPRDSHWASVARKVCWMPAAILMSLCGWIWGGTAALPARVFRDPALAERWSQSVSSDASIREIIHARHLRLEWVPSLVMPNLEPGRFKALVSHLGRSLATSRLYLNRWPLTLLAVGFAAGALILTVLVCAISVLTANTTATVVSTTGLGAYLLVLIALLLLVERRASNICRYNRAKVPPLNITMLAKIVPVIPLAHGIYLVSAVKAHFVRSLTWRGVRYAINGKLDVQREEPSPLSPLPAGADYVLLKEQTGNEIDTALVNTYASRFDNWRQMIFRRKSAQPHRLSQLAPHKSIAGREPVERERWKQP